VTPEFAWSGKRAAMIVAHPGHELRVFHWLELARPDTLVLTDGSGRTGTSRMCSTMRILNSVGSKTGPVFGRFTDCEIYDEILAGNSIVFLELLEEVANWLVTEQIDYVAGDALEGYNATHDICRYIIGAACELGGRRLGRTITNFDFLLTGPPDSCPVDLQSPAICIRLDDAALERKLAAATGYCELRQEMELALNQFGKNAFATEWLRPVKNRAGLNPALEPMRYYETYGERQRIAGHYQRVIRWREHLLPLVRTLWTRLDESGD